MNRPKLAMCNYLPDPRMLRETALALGFEGIDWTLHPGDLSRPDELKEAVRAVAPLEVRYHCAFKGVDMGDADVVKAEKAVELFRSACRVVSELEGRYMTVHLGLGRTAMDELLWDRSVETLAELADYARETGIVLCLENLASGWTSRPELFEKLVRKSGAGVTLDIGHAGVSPSVESKRFDFEDFIAPHAYRVHNAHIYHEERDNRHTAPETPEDLWERLTLLSALPCDWWVLELRETELLLQTLGAVRKFLDASPVDRLPPESPDWAFAPPPPEQLTSPYASRAR